MRRIPTSVRVIASSRAILLTATAGLLLAGCSSDTTRFNYPAFTGSTPNQEAMIGSVGNGGTATVASAAPASQVTRSDLPPPPGTVGSSYGQSGGYASQTYSAQQPGYTPSGQTYSAQQASYTPSGQTYGAQPATYASSPSNPSYGTQQATYAPSQPAYGAASASSQTVTVAPGETLYTLSRRYGVPVDQLMRANGITDPTSVAAGRRLVIPAAGASGTASAPAPQTGTAPMTYASATPPAPKPRPQGVRAAPAVPNAVASNAASQLPNEASTVPREGPRVASLGPAPGVNPGEAVSAPPNAGVQAASTPTEPSTDSRSGLVGNEVTALPDAPAMSAQTFRWPVRGRIIAGFGEKPGGQRNDGINLAVPEGTSVRAAENGVVVYAGNELKGYGNLILIKHANGWVTAYAHNSELLVKRGDTVSRGQIIARAGATGSVTSPQLHFELRQGAKPVDPLKYLAQS